MVEDDYRPSKINNDTVRVAGWELSVSSTIDSAGTAEQVIKGWDLLQTELGSDIMDRLFQPFFILTIFDADRKDVRKIRGQEPRIIELLRFGYWYLKVSKSDKSNTFAEKRSEIKGKISRKAMTNVEAYKSTSIDQKLVKDQEEFKKLASSGVSLAKQGKKLDSAFEIYMKELRRTLWSVISELQLAGISQDSGLVVGFSKPTGEHDHDIIIDGIPCQVKTITTEDDNARELFKLIADRSSRYMSGHDIGENEVDEAVKNDISYRYKSIIKSIDQGVRIILINGTHSYSGFLANKYSSDRSLLTPLYDVLKKSISLLSKNHDNEPNSSTENIYVILGAGAIDINYRYSAWGFQILYDTNTKTLNLNEMKKI
jgi:hypothetical protein